MPTDSPGSPEEGAVSTLLSVGALQKSFGSTRVLEAIDLEVRRGEVLVLIGPSGSGKTTLLRCLNGLETADSGRVIVNRATNGDFRASATSELRVDFSANPSKRTLAELRDCSAMVFQHYNLFPHKTVLENVVEGPVVVQRRSREAATADALELLERVGLADKRDSHPFELSGGQQQRVGIVRALALKPQLLLFDEPTSALDPELVGDVLGLMKQLALDGWTMVIVTHELQFAKEVADEVAFIDGGVIVEQAPPARLFSNPRQERTHQFLHRLLFPF